MKRLLSCLLILVILLATVVLGVQATDVDVSGDLNSTKPTKVEILEKWHQVTYATSLYDETPSVSAPYATGRLSKNFLKSGITYLNYVRYVANLPQVQLDDTLNESAQHGAVLMAAEDDFSHFPSQPSDMDDSFYQKGYEATSTSNISARYGYAPLTSLQSSVLGCMADSNSLSNLQVVGHRRWLLNPKLLNVGFGYAESNTGWSYIDTKVFDRSGSGCDYDFISWPASGNFPTNLFDTQTPWSVTLNPQKYQTPQKSKLKITITRQADGKQWKFDSTTAQPVSNAEAYLTVDTNGYGIPNCIIFHPGSQNVDAYEGVFRVNITGLYTQSGQATQLTYEVDFFDVDSVSLPLTIVTQPKSVAVPTGSTAKVTVKATGEGLTYRWYFKDPGATEYTYTSTFKGNSYQVTMNDARNGRRVLCRVYDKYGNVVQTKIATLSMLKQTVKITQQPASVTVAKGATAKVTFNATGDGLSYKWYFKNKGASKFSLSSMKTSTYTTTMDATRTGRQVYCKITDKYGNTVTTTTVTIRMKATITKQPASVVVANGTTAKVTVSAAGEGLTYKWYFKNKGASKFTLSSVKTSSYTTTMDVTRTGRQIYCKITDKYGNTVTTKTVTLNMKATITKQPASVTVANGTTAKVTVSAAGEGLTYKWYFKNKGATKFSLSSIKTKSYSTTMKSAVNGRQVYCKVTDKFGNTVTTKTVTLNKK